MGPPLAAAIQQLYTNTIKDSCINSFTSPCPAIQAQESLSSLLAARSFAHVDSHRAWDEIHSLFAGQGENGFLPLIRFVDGSGGYEWLPNTIYPGANSGYYGGVNAAQYAPKYCGYNSTMNLAAMPFHASMILELFFLSEETKEDVDNLELYFKKLMDWHKWLHQYRTYGNIVHPFESSLPLASPVWSQSDILKATLDEVARRDWAPQKAVPESVRFLADFPGDQIFNAELFLLENMNNTTDLFNMQDIGFLSALAASDIALAEINHILKDKNRPYLSGSDAQMIIDWKAESRRGIDALWNADEMVYGSKFTPPVEKKNSVGVYGVGSPLSATTFVNKPTSDAFFVLFATYSGISNTFLPTSHTDEMVFSLLGGAGTAYGFDCGAFGVRSSGCALSDEKVAIYPSTNFFLSRGLKDNKAEELSHWIANNTISLVCNTSLTETNGGVGPGDMCMNNFARAFNVGGGVWGGGGRGAAVDVCGMNSSVGASTFVNLLMGDGEFTFTSAPPIANGWVFIIIGCELFVALTIGVTCLVFSVNLVKKLRKNEDFDNFNFLRVASSDRENEMNSSAGFYLGSGEKRGLGDERKHLLSAEEEEEGMENPGGEEELHGAWNLFMSYASYLNPYAD